MDCARRSISFYYAVMKNNHPHTSEVKSFIEELKEIKKSLAEDWQGMSEEQIMCLQEEVQDINDAINRLLRKQHD